MSELQTVNVAAAVEEFVRRQFAVSPNDRRFDRRTDLFEAGYVDSVGIAELLEFLRERFGIDIPESDLFSDDFTTIDGIARIVARLRAE
jgi:acyl carrier protein